MACHDDAQKLAAAYLDNRELPDVDLLAVADVRGTATLKTEKSSCPVAVVARPIPEPGSSGAVEVSWSRPTTEAAKATGGKLIACGP
jgi:hypothetical protein